VSTNPKDAIGLTKPALRLVPPALALHVSQAMANGAKKYGAYNWREHPVRLTVYIEAALRHLYSLLDGEDHARDSGVLHAAHVGACMAIILDAMGTDSLIDDRATDGCASDLIDELTAAATPPKPAGETIYTDVNFTIDRKVFGEIEAAVVGAVSPFLGRRVLVTAPPPVKESRGEWAVDFLTVDGEAFADDEDEADTQPEQHPVDAALDTLVAGSLDFVRAYPMARPLKIGDTLKRGAWFAAVCADELLDSWRLTGWTHADGTPIEPIPVCGAV
jgi:hypothetical protein